MWLALAAAALIALFCAAPAAADVERIQIYLTDGNDYVGYLNSDVPVEIHAGDGDDYIEGSKGDDIIHGGEGNDMLYGFGGDDLVDGGDGHDNVKGDVEWAGAGADGDDLVRGGPGYDHLFGNGGGDRLEGGVGIDTHSYEFHEHAVTVVIDDLANDGAEGEGDTIAVDVEQVNGSPHGDTLIGNAERNYFIALGGDDALIGRGGADYLLAGDGDDALYGDEALLAGPLPVGPLPAGVDAGPFAPRDEPFEVQADGGDDELRGYGGSDLVVGGPGVDYMLGDFGNFEPPQPGVPADDYIDAREPEDGPAVRGEGPSCDEGQDAASLDGDDNPWRCEVTDYSGRSKSPPQFPPYSTPPEAPPIVDVPGTLTSARGAVTAKVLCNSAVRCSGRAALAKGSRALGEREFSIGPGSKARVRVVLTQAGRRYVQRRRKVGARLDVFAAGTPSAAPAWRGSVVLRRSGL